MPHRRRRTLIATTTLAWRSKVSRQSALAGACAGVEQLHHLLQDTGRRPRIWRRAAGCRTARQWPRGNRDRPRSSAGTSSNEASMRCKDRVEPLDIGGVRRSAPQGARSAARACGASRRPRPGRPCWRAPQSGRSGRAARHRALRTRATLPCWIWITPIAARWRMASRAIGLLMPKAAAIWPSDGSASPGFSRPSRMASLIRSITACAEPHRDDLGRTEQIVGGIAPRAEHRHRHLRRRSWAGRR